MTGKANVAKEKSHWRCKCVCGKDAVVSVTALRLGKTKSCGCLMREVNTIHGMSSVPEFRVWWAMKERCLNPNHKQFKDYGGRGITIVPEWIDSFAAFYSHVGPRPSPKLSLGRIDNSGGYYPGNVEWQTQKEQMRNTRQNHLVTFNGTTMPLTAWAERMGIRPRVLASRLDSGWPVERALTAPVDVRARGEKQPHIRAKQRAAHSALAYAVRMGRLRKPGQCQHPGCTETRVQAHHHRGYERDYWLDVEWLCPGHHAATDALSRRQRKAATIAGDGRHPDRLLDKR